jgi:hypothetical protein
VENFDWQQNLTSISYSSIALGDMDNDGDLNPAIGRDTRGGQGIARSFINNGKSPIENYT